MTYNKLTCLFGHHQYSDEKTQDKAGRSVYLCKICERSGYYKYSDGCEVWTDYDGEGNCIHDKWDDGLEVWYAWSGNISHVKHVDGHEVWYDEKGNVTRQIL